MQDILNDIQSTAKRCMDTAKAMHDALEAADMGYIWGIVEVILPSSSMRSLPRGSSTPPVRMPMPQSRKNQILKETKPTVAPAASSVGLSLPIRPTIVQPMSNHLAPQPALAEVTKNARATPRLNRPAIEALRSVLANAEHPCIRAAYEANRIVEYVEISVLPKVGVLVEEYHDKAVESHQNRIAKLVSKRDEIDRFLKKSVRKVLLEKVSVDSRISAEDKSAFLDIFLGRGRESAMGFLLASMVLPELGAALSKVANRIHAKLAVLAAKSEVVPPQASSTRHANNAVQAVDFIILTAVDVELKAVLKAFGLTRDNRVKMGTRVYWKGSVRLNDEESYTIVVAQATDMANPEAAVLTMDMIHHWNPSAALFVGIAATTVPTKVGLGDVVVGTEVYYYERRKETAKGARPEPKSIPADPTLLNNIRSMDWDNEVSVSRPDAASKKPKVHFGVIGCGEKVIADAKKRDRLTKANRKILAIEMEGYGFSLAACHSFEKVRHLDIRGVCDDASDSKDDLWHEYAAVAAATLAKDFLLDRPLEPRAKPVSASPEPIQEHVV